jgi:hypothetical protein
MQKSTFILMPLTLALGLCAAYFHRQHETLAQSIALDREQCTRQLAQLQNEYQAQLGELQQQLLQPAVAPAAR